MLRALPEDVIREGEDARVLFVRGIYYRRETMSAIVDLTNALDFSLQAEPENEADPFAVMVMINGEKVGYIPRELAVDIQPMVVSSRCRVAARGPVHREGDSFSVAILLAWKAAA